MSSFGGNDALQQALEGCQLNRCPDWNSCLAPKCCVFTTPLCPPPGCEDEDDQQSTSTCPGHPPPNCYSITIPPEMGDCCGSKVTYDFGPYGGISRKVKNKWGNTNTTCDDSQITLEAYRGPGGCEIGTGCLRIHSDVKTAEYCPCPPPCCECPCPPQQDLLLIPCCPKPPCPPPCKIRRKVTCCRPLSYSFMMACDNNC